MSVFDKVLFYGSYLALYVVVVFGLSTISTLLNSTELKATVGLRDLLFSLLLGFIYWYCEIALGKLQAKRKAMYPNADSP